MQIVADKQLLYAHESKLIVTIPVDNFSCTQRPTKHGKFLFVGDEKFWVRGVTYGTFRPAEDGTEYLSPGVVERDFAAMAENGINTVRTYTVPPCWLLDLAQHYGLRVMVGLPWEQHIAFLDDIKRVKAIENRVQEAIESCAKHPAILCYSVGNEIPSSIVRFYGRDRIERFIKQLYTIAKTLDPDCLVTYVNFPTTEYLQLPFLDLICFNVYLESRENFEAYLAHLQTIAGDRPLLMTEIGLDSRRNGQEAQSSSLDWQIGTSFENGCAGVFIFAWTDEWHRGGYDIEDWDFGLTTRGRTPKPALQTVSRAYSQVPFSLAIRWPRISVVVCSYNGARTIRDTMEGLQKLDYPDYEVIVVNDGSKDKTAEIASEYNIRLVNTENRGLSSARNTGWQEATGEIVAYSDDDAYPDPDWLKFLASTFLKTSCVGVGGLNLAPPDDGTIADCVDNAPGGPIHVLLTDNIAEHIPGCNMAFRKSALEAIGGFDPRFRTAGDDVDICWRLQQKGWKIGFNGAAVVWHHRRNSIKTYWKQQLGYGKAEALLERKWPEKYNQAGHVAWAGCLYGHGLTEPVHKGRWRVYQGVWGSALFQRLYKSAPSTFFLFPLMPEWYFVIAFLAFLTSLGILWNPLLTSLPLFILALAAPVIQAVLSAKSASFPSPSLSVFHNLKLRILTAFLHLTQPIARLVGRLSHGLTPWRHRGVSGTVLPFCKTITRWSETWHSPEQWLSSFEASLRALNTPLLRGGDFDGWDLEVRGGMFGAVRTLMAIEEHGGGRQLVRFRIWPRCSVGIIVFTLAFAALSFLAGINQAWGASVPLGIVAALSALRWFQEISFVMSTILHANEQKVREF